MSEKQNTDGIDPRPGAAEGAALKSQVGALVVLVLVFGAIWLLFRYLPAGGDWIAEKTGQVIGDAPAEEEGTEKLLSTTVETETNAVPRGEIPGSYREQIVAQLGGPGRVEVRHLALSQDGTRMVAALQLTGEDGKKRLVEVFLEEDEFGRFLSAEDSPDGVALKLWSDFGL